MMRAFALSVIMLCAAVLASATPSRYMFKHITMENGLSNNQVNDIYKDADGFMWFSTAWGLNRFDGYSMTLFINSAADSTSLSQNYVEWVRDIAGDCLLVKTGTGFDIYDKRHDDFRSGASFLKEIGFASAEASNVLVDKRGDVWLASENNCYLWRGKQRELVDMKLRTLCQGASKQIVAMAEAPDSSVHVIYNSGEIAVMKFSEAEQQPQAHIRKSPLANDATSLFIDSDGDGWVTTTSGLNLWHYCHRTDTWHYCTPAKNSYFRISESIVNGVRQDWYGNLWIYYDHGGIDIMNKNTRSVTNLKNDRADDRSLLSNSINCVYPDNSGMIWVGYFKTGISLYNESIFKFYTDKIFHENDNNEVNVDINTIEEDLDGNMWYGTNGSGLIFVNSVTGQKRIFRHNAADRYSLPSDIIVDILAASDGSIWVGTYQGGLARFDGHRFHCYKGAPNLPASFTDDNIWAIAEDGRRNLWVGSLGKGVCCINPTDMSYTEYTVKQGCLSHDYVSSLIVSRSGIVYVGTAAGITALNLTNNTSMLLDQYGHIHNNINDVYEDSRGLIWAATQSGIYVVDNKNGTTSKISMGDGLVNDVTQGIAEDNDKNMWVTTANGIANIMVSLNPRTNEYSYTIYNYNELDGIQGRAFNQRSMKKTSYGEMLVGGSFGVNRFMPEQIKYNKETPNVTFTRLSVLGNDVKVGDNLLPDALNYSKHITLDYSQNMFTVFFSSLSYILPEKVCYSYTLEGFNDKWITTSQHWATYTNLAPGEYTLKVRAINCDGYSTDTATELTITVLPPWWKTTWAYILYAALFVLCIWYIRQQITRKEREKYKLKQIEAEVQKNNEVDGMKLKFFTNVSHELRTPLSLIISPVENLIAESADPILKRKLELIHRNATKLMNMVNQLLDFRKADVHGMQLNVSDGDIVAFIRQACDSFVALAERDINFSLSSSLTSLYTRFDRDKIEKIMSNLLSNAFKFTPDRGQVDVWLGRTNDGSKLIIKVADTGIGIPDDCKPHVFERFYQVQNNEGDYGGSGIGLHLVKEFAALHGGEVSVADNIGQGTVFVVTLPIKDIDSDTEPADDADEMMPSAEAKCKILIVDDNADFRTLLKDTLNADYDIIESRNGEEALAEAVKSLPDLIISDIMMPVMDGLEFCSKVKNDMRTSHIPFVMLTAKSAEEHKIEGLSSGCDDYITKPFNPQILKLRVAKLIELGKKRQEKFRRQIDPEPSEITITPLDEKLINKAIKYVEDNMSRSELSVEEMSRYLGMSRVHLYKKLISITGRSPIEFIRVIRLKRAAQMLRDKQQNVSDVAYSVGFNNPKYFSKYFKEEFGILPSVYQNDPSAANLKRDKE